MILSERKRKILLAVVEDYIQDGAPVSSKDIQEKYLPDCSSATIRNELSALESMGYLVQPHVSSGRVPSEKAFRLYVDELMETEPLTGAETALIDRYFESYTDRMGSVEGVVANVAKLISDITNYTSVAVKSFEKSENIKSITVLPISEDNALVVIVTDAQVLKDNVIHTENLDMQNAGKASEWLNRMFAGKSLEELKNRQGPMEIVAKEFRSFRSLYEQVLNLIVRLADHRENAVFTEGRAKIFDYPEYSDIDRAKHFLTSLEDNNGLAEAVSQTREGIDFSIKIGEETGIEDGCSIVSARLSVNEKTLGSAGVIGPVRMNYRKVIKVLEHINTLVAKVLTDDEEE